MVGSIACLESVAEDRVRRSFAADSQRPFTRVLSPFAVECRDDVSESYELSPTEKQLMKESLWSILNWNQDRVMLIDLGPVGARGDECMEFWGEPRTNLPRRCAVIV